MGGTPLQSGNTVYHPYPGPFPGGQWDHEFYAYWCSSEFDTKYAWVVGLVKKGYRINMGYQKDSTPTPDEKIFVRSFVNF